MTVSVPVVDSSCCCRDTRMHTQPDKQNFMITIWNKKKVCLNMCVNDTCAVKSFLKAVHLPFALTVIENISNHTH